MGWYAGTGGRLMFTSGSVAGVQQPIPAPDSNNGNLIECKWNPSYTLKIPGSWTTGVYLTKLTGSTKGYQSYIIFVVRANNPAPLLFVSSVTTYQAYNNWGGKSLYDYNSGGAG